MNKFQLAGMLLLLAAPMVAWSVPQGDYREQSVATLETRYGWVVAAEKIEDGTHVATGAIIGGLIGLGSSSGKSGKTKVGRTAGGALLGGVIGSKIDKSKHSLYTIELVGGGEVQAVLPKRSLIVGDCAAVRYRTDRTDVDYASDYYCAAGPSLETYDDPTDPCLEAKRRLLEATDPQEIEVWERKVAAICDTRD